MTDANVRGKFVWHTLLTADAQAAAEYYGKVLGWKTVTASPDSPHTLLLSLPSGPLAGVLEFPTDDAQSAAAHWRPHIGTSDIRATIEQCEALGGAVLEDATLIPNMGELAVLTDPQGSEFAVYMPSGDAHGSENDAELGEFSWHELATTDLTAAIDFYQQLFDWEVIAEHDMGPMGAYVIFGREGKQLGGMFKAMGDDPMAPNWLSYVRVADAEKSAAKVRAAGGQVTNGPGEVPGGDWITQCLDPQGAAFAVHALGNVAKAMPAEAEALLEDSEEFTATLVMDRNSLVVPTAKKKRKRKTQKPASTAAKSATSGKAAAKKTKKTAVTPVKKKSKKTPRKPAKKANKTAARAVKKSSKPVKGTARKHPSRAPAKGKKPAKRKK